jgi:hypothetical protein
LTKHIVAEPPAKLRKTAENISNVKRPASAQSMARPAASSNQQLRAPSRLMNGVSQTSTSRFASSTTGYRSNTTQNGYTKQLSQSTNQLPRSHARSKSHITGYRQPNASQDQVETAQQQSSNGMKPFTISSFYRQDFKSAPRHASVSVSSQPNRIHQHHHVSPRSCSAPAHLCPTSMVSIREIESGSSEDSSLASALQTGLFITNCTSLSLEEKAKSGFSNKSRIIDSENHVSSQPEYSISPKQNGLTRGSRLPRLSPVKTRMLDIPPPSPLQTTVRRMSPKKGSGPTNSPTRPLFLSKDSNLTHPDWGDNGMEDRMKMMETMFHALKGQMEGTSFERSSTKELIDTMKMRSKLNIFLLNCPLTKLKFQSP